MMRLPVYALMLGLLVLPRAEAGGFAAALETGIDRCVAWVAGEEPVPAGPAWVRVKEDPATDAIHGGTYVHTEWGMQIKAGALHPTANPADLKRECLVAQVPSGPLAIKFRVANGEWIEDLPPVSRKDALGAIGAWARGKLADPNWRDVMHVHGTMTVEPPFQALEFCAAAHGILVRTYAKEDPLLWNWSVSIVRWKLATERCAAG